MDLLLIEGLGLIAQIGATDVISAYRYVNQLKVSIGIRVGAIGHGVILNGDGRTAEGLFTYFIPYGASYRLRERLS